MRGEKKLTCKFWLKEVFLLVFYRTKVRISLPLMSLLQKSSLVLSLHVFLLSVLICILFFLFRFFFLVAATIKQQQQHTSTCCSFIVIILGLTYPGFVLWNVIRHCTCNAIVVIRATVVAVFVGAKALHIKVSCVRVCICVAHPHYFLHLFVEVKFLILFDRFSRYIDVFSLRITQNS